MIGERGVTVRETVDARKNRYGEGDLEDLFAGARTLVVAKGQKSLRFDLKGDPDWAEIEAVALGRSGNLRAPTARLGKTILVGFNDEAWADVG